MKETRTTNAIIDKQLTEERELSQLMSVFKESEEGRNAAPNLK